MLVIDRRVREVIRIGDDITVTVTRVDRNKVRIGIAAPRGVVILRGELVGRDAPPPAKPGARR